MFGGGLVINNTGHRLVKLQNTPKKLLFYKSKQGFVPVCLDASIRVSISVNFFGDISESLHLISSAFLPSIIF